MQKFIDTATAAGNGGVLTPLGNATVDVFITGTTTRASLYSDNGVTAKSNPFTSTATGAVAFYAPDDRYDIVVTKAGFSPVTVADVILEDIDDSVVTDISNAAIIDSSFSNGTVVGSAVQSSTLSANTIVGGTLAGTTVSGVGISGSTIATSAITGGTASGVAVTGSTVNSSPVGISAPDRGRFTSVQLASGATGTIGFGEIRLNTNELTLDVGLSGGVVGQMFEETFIAFTNNTSTLMTSGQVVSFDGVDNTNSIPYGRLVTATDTYEPMYTIGVVTQDVAPNSYGRATTLGKVRSVNTTGFQFGEVWAAGDLVYASPTVPGGLTNLEPAVPNQHILIGVVLRVGATTGTLLVRPYLSDHHHYGAFSSSVSQTLPADNTASVITYNTIDIASGIALISASRITPNRPGLYRLDFRAQLNKPGGSTAQFWVWLRRNGVDVPGSTKTLTEKGGQGHVVAAWGYTLAVTAGAYYELVWASDDATSILEAAAPQAFCPSIPSVSVSMQQIQ
jgi:hypothetical protein